MENCKNSITIINEISLSLSIYIKDRLVWTQFESLAQMINEFRLKKPNTMNL